MKRKPLNGLLLFLALFSLIFNSALIPAGNHRPPEPPSSRKFTNPDEDSPKNINLVMNVSRQTATPGDPVFIKVSVKNQTGARLQSLLLNIPLPAGMKIYDISAVTSNTLEPKSHGKYDEDILDIKLDFDKKEDSNFVYFHIGNLGAGEMAAITIKARLTQEAVDQGKLPLYSKLFFRGEGGVMSYLCTKVQYLVVSNSQ